MKRSFGTLIAQNSASGANVIAGQRAALLITAVVLLFLHRRREARYAAGMLAAAAYFNTGRGQRRG